MAENLKLYTTKKVVLVCISRSSKLKMRVSEDIEDIWAEIESINGDDIDDDYLENEDESIILEIIM